MILATALAAGQYQRQPDRLLDVGGCQAVDAGGGNWSPRNQWRWLGRRILEVMKPARAATRRFLPASPFNAYPADPPIEQFAVQDQVTHDKYGLGRVIRVEDDTALIVEFGSRQVRILSPFAKLTKL